MPRQPEELFPQSSRHHRRGPNTRALGTTLQAMRDGGLLERVDEAVVVAARDAAMRLDAAGHDPDESRFVVGRLSADYREWLGMIARLAPGGDRGDVDALLALLRDGA